MTDFTINDDGELVDVEGNLILPIPLTRQYNEYENSPQPSPNIFQELGISYDADADVNNENAELAQRFETMLVNEDYPVPRQCRFTNTTQAQFDAVLPGRFILLPVSGGGYLTQWYYYVSLNGTKMYVFRTVTHGTDMNERFSYNYRILPNGPDVDENLNEILDEILNE